MSEKKMKTPENGKPEQDHIAMDINTDESIAGTSHLNEAVAEESELEKLKEQLEEQKEKYLRLYADFENHKRRNAKERVELIQTAGKEVITALLEVLDDFERAEKQMEKSEPVNEMKEGIQLISGKLKNTLQSKGLTAMESIGQEFNPDRHEAVTEIEVPDSKMKGKVVDELVKGYYLNGKIIRFAKVVVGK
jgi:molecular chaperone GrpE